jgi:hypothetical protein
MGATKGQEMPRIFECNILNEGQTTDTVHSGAGKSVGEGQRGRSVPVANRLLV